MPKLDMASVNRDLTKILPGQWHGHQAHQSEPTAGIVSVRWPSGSDPARLWSACPVAWNTVNNGELVMTTPMGAQDAVKIDASGRVGIGTPNPDPKVLL